ncbi:uncharacterized protein BKA78DRAFT_354132 [Phyllosticta capitalensis]|uniref:Basic proline-rich protein n=1 Tax=Phyllosticta capitalensis TaxID=121624 RepID=A0ABR1YLF6_9PEZI
MAADGSSPTPVSCEPELDRSPAVPDEPSTPSSTLHTLRDLSLQDRDARPVPPETPRRLTDPVPSRLLQPPHLSPQYRNRSPYSRSHLRSTSLSAPALTRTHSSPTPMSPTAYLTTRPSSPLRSPARLRTPIKLDEPYLPALSSNNSDIGIISEDRELHVTSRGTPLDRSTDTSSFPGMHSGNSFSRQRRRPTSPLYSVSSPPTPAHPSPTLSATKFNERFPSDVSYPSSSYSSSSMPSTPTSMRSRSPSISSLETIPDSPDAEEAAIEADRVAKLEAAAKAADGGRENLRRSSLDVPRARPGGFGMASRDKRKRWSVCGAEKRGDLDLETIWED